MAKSYPTGQQWAKIYARAWKDAKFRDRLEKDPASALAEVKAEFRITANRVFKVPPRPKDINDKQLNTMEEGGGYVHPEMCC